MDRSKFRKMKETAGRFLRERGYYVVLVLCLAVLGVAGAFALWPVQVDEPDPTPSGTDEPVSQSSDQQLASVTPVPTPTTTPVPTILPDFTPVPSNRPAGVSGQKAPAPVEGEVLWEYAMDQLIYSKTLDQWTTHSGVDIACKLGTKVHAIAAGQVQEVYTDDRMGVCVVVQHSGNRTSVYANLAEEPPVKEGDQVKAGDLVGAVGNSAVSECAMDPHLHLEFLVEDQYVNPREYILLP